MTIFLPQYFELLKTAVITTSGLKSVTPCDCRTISVLVYNKTKQSLSETTLKRVYGFAFSKFKPSLFTIDVMAKYCGYTGWDHFCEKQEEQFVKSATANTNWETLKQHADKITNFTLQALKNKAGIPYNLTLKRKFVYDHFEEFLTGNHTATAFCAPAGYGKTLGLCHWVEDKLSQSAEGNNNDIILFFSSSALMNVFLSGRNINDWILGLLGYTADEDISSLIDVTQRKEGNFYLVLDGLDEHAYKPEQFKLLINQIIDIFSLYKDTPWFKLVLTMRSATWVNNMHELQDEEGKWFKGFVPDNILPSINVPLFNMQEIKQLCQNINPSIQNFLAIELSQNFNHPLYFQFYYKQYKDNFSLNNVDHVCIYELISTFILNKVYLGQHSSDKVLLIKSLVDEMDFKNDKFIISKVKVNGLIKQYQAAYQELISVGFIRELNESSDVIYHTFIEFGNSNFLQYSIAKTLLFENDYVFDDKLIDVINTQFNDPHKLFILKWCIIYAFKTSQQSNYGHLTKADLTSSQKSELVVFLGELLKKSCAKANNLESIVQYFKQDNSDELFNYFFGLEFVSPDHKKTLQTLLQFELTDHKKILVYTGLAAISILQLDTLRVDEYLAKLKSFPQHNFQQFAVNPISCIEAINQFLKFGTVKRDFYAEVTRFYFNPDIYSAGLNTQKTNELVYLLAGYSLMICRKPYKILRFYSALQKVYKPDPGFSQAYCFLVKLLQADSYRLLKNCEKTIALYNEISAIYDKQEDSLTPYMRSVYYGFKIKIALLKKEYVIIPGYLKYMNQVTDEVGNKMSKAFISFLILDSDCIMQSNPQFYKQVQYDVNKLLRECSLNATIFTPVPVLN